MNWPWKSSKIKLFNIKKFKFWISINLFFILEIRFLSKLYISTYFEIILYRYLNSFQLFLHDSHILAWHLFLAWQGACQAANISATLINSPTTSLNKIIKMLFTHFKILPYHIFNLEYLMWK